jgi:hypothetical protein
MPSNTNQGDEIDEILNALQESTIVIDCKGSVLGPEEDARAFQAVKDKAKANLAEMLLAARIETLENLIEESETVVHHSAIYDEIDTLTKQLESQKANGKQL